MTKGMFGTMARVWKNGQFMDVWTDDLAQYAANGWTQTPTSSSSSSSASSTYNPYSSTGSNTSSNNGTTTVANNGTLPSSGSSSTGSQTSSGSSNPFSLTTTNPTYATNTGGTGSYNAGGNYGNSSSPIITAPMGPGPGGSATMGTNYNPSYGVTQGTYSATRAPYNLGGEQQVDTNLQTQMNVMGQGNPFQNIAQGYANTAGYNSAQTGGQALNQANNMYSGANAVMNTAFDPQQQLYNQLHQQNMDQSNVIAAQRGITSSPYGARVANEANTNFNIDWQNAQLARQTQGLNAAGQANTTGANLGSTGVTAINNAGQIPYATGQQALSNQQQSIQDYLAYLGHGTQASAASTQANAVNKLKNESLNPSIVFGGQMSAFGPGTVSYL